MIESTHGVWIQQHLWVQTKDSGVVPFRFTETQKKFYDSVRKQQKAGDPVRKIVVKSRQVRITTVTQAMLFEDLWRNPNKNSLVVGNDDAVAQNILAMTHRFYNHLPAGMKSSNTLKHQTKREFVYDHPHNSRQVVITAKRGDTGAKSFTFQNVHLSEAADYYLVSNPEILWATIMASVPVSSPQTMIVVESTGSGQDPFFYKMAMMVQAGEMPGWEMLFFPWHEENEYQLKLRNPIKMTYEERELSQQFGLTAEQIAWRRHVLKTECFGNVHLFQRYYPATLEEAFMASSGGLFDGSTCDRKKKDCANNPPIAVGDFILNSDGRPSFNRNLTGGWKIWEKPSPSGEYVIGADPSKYATKADKAAAHVIDKRRMKVVASFNGNIENHEFAKQLFACGVHYNTALLVPENNVPILAYELTQHIPYPNLYWYRTGEEMGRYSKGSVSRPGVNMNGKSRAIGIERLLKVYSEILDCSDPVFWDQLSHFKQTDYVSGSKAKGARTMKDQVKAKFQAESSLFEDDSVMAMVCGLYAIQESYIQRRVEEGAQSEQERIYHMIQDVRAKRRRMMRSSQRSTQSAEDRSHSFGCGTRV